MRQFADIFTIRTAGRGLIEVTNATSEWATSRGLQVGLLTLFCRHTSASLLIQENASPAVRSDLTAWFERIAPEDPCRLRPQRRGAGRYARPYSIGADRRAFVHSPGRWTSCAWNLAGDFSIRAPALVASARDRGAHHRRMEVSKRNAPTVQVGAFFCQRPCRVQIRSVGASAIRRPRLAPCPWRSRSVPKSCPQAGRAVR